MLPLSYQLPAAVALMAGGVVTCFAGYRLFRFVLGAYGFILGALVASSMVGTADTWAIVVSAIAGGAVGALILVAGYFVGVALVGAGTAAFLLNVIYTPWRGEPQWVLVIVAAAIGAFVAIWFQRHVIVAATAFGGAWTMLVGLAALMAGKSAKAASATTDVWVVYPSAAGLPATWVYAAWIVLSLVGMYVQFHAGGKQKQKKKQ
ncbi:MAG: DUF4203 domain-containing protein [Acidobacteria bacterium]|nr:DUF4203 domain-containing protein [Acidobacteriota bacterium]